MIKNKKNKTYKFYVFSAPLLILGIDEKIWKISLIVLAFVILLVCLIKIAIRARKNKEKNNQEIEIIVEKTKPIIIQKKEEMKPMKKEERKIKNNNLDNNGIYIRYNYSFVARMHQAPKESQERFSEIKNYLLSYEGVTVRKSWRNERFMYQGRPIVKFWIHGNILDAYINLNFDELRNTRYEVEDMRGKKLHDNTPVLFKVSTHKAVIQLKELIDIHMKKIGAIKDREENIDYTLPYVSKEDLLKQKSIKINK